eukprot:6801026-Prorocentrum_lima.AAC.1
MTSSLVGSEMCIRDRSTMCARVQLYHERMNAWIVVLIEVLRPAYAHDVILLELSPFAFSLLSDVLYFQARSASTSQLLLENVYPSFPHVVPCGS